VNLLLGTTQRIDSDEGTVTKFVHSCNNAVAETVLYRYPDYKTRTVICCSTQSGCPVGCRFCGAGEHFVRSLTSKEIVIQVVRAIETTGVRARDMNRLQVMFMSMGEPLLNPAIYPAIEELYDCYPNAALLISTIGPRVSYHKLREISQRIWRVGLQFSVHETTDEARNKLIPFAKKLTLEEIASEGTRWYLATKRSPFFNYCAGEHNTTEADADRLARLFTPSIWKATVSVICEKNEGMPSRTEKQRMLADGFSGLLLQRGFDVRVFDPAGQDDIGGGCGQLWFVQRWMKEHPELAKPTH
jgi:23S rRNA (adenine2503-C2)-methyltransferase